MDEQALTKNQSFFLFACFFAMKLQKERMAYSMNKALKPMAASSFVRGRALRVSMMTRYVGPRVLTPVIPMSAGT